MPKKVDRGSLRGLVPDLRRLGCISYQAGHNIHWIQALHSSNHKAVSAQTWRGKVVAVDGEVLTVLNPDGDISRFRNHDPARLVFILKHLGVDVTVNDQYAILRAGITPARAFCISVQADTGEPLGPCPTGDLSSDLSADQQLALRTRVRFSTTEVTP
jgi:hypothetical protein